MATSSFELELHDIHCASCVSIIEGALLDDPAISQASVNFADRTVSITSDKEASHAVGLLKKAGYLASVSGEDNQDTSGQDAFRTGIRRTIIAGVFGGAALFLELAGFAPDLSKINGQLISGAIGLIALVAMIYAGGHFYKSAWKALKKHSASMDTLVSLGTAAAWCYSMIVTVAPLLFPPNERHLFFDAALLVMAFINLGNAIEQRARSHTSSAIRRLFDLLPKTALRIEENGDVTTVPVATLKVGDQVQVKPGDTIPLDGVVHSGSSYVDESMITGESKPIQKAAKETVIGGTLNGNGSFTFMVTATGRDTALAGIIEAVKQANASKPRLARLADTIAGYFVPVVIILAIVTAVVWALLGYPAGYVLSTSMSVLIIACPCALGLASPIAVMIGTGLAAKKGILIRQGEALQQASQLTTIIFDKTGTLTLGKPSVTAFHVLGDVDEKTLIQQVATVEQQSEHPVANAFVQHAKSCGIPLTEQQDFKAIPGQGAQANVNGLHISIGNKALMAANKIETISADCLEKEITDAGYSPIWIAQGHSLVGIAGIADPIRESASELIEQCHHMGLTTIMLTGDNEQTAHHVARALGIDTVIANVRPEEKHQVVQKQQSKGERVAMIGDGINDAAALQQANLGIAIGTGTDIAIESADIALMTENLQRIIDAIHISSATIRNVKQNLFGAFIYNIVAIPVAAGIAYPLFHMLLNPTIASAAMAASSLTVVANANRLRRHR